MKATWFRLTERIECHGRLVTNTDCCVAMTRGTNCIKLPDGLVLCPKCWKIYQKSWNRSPAHKKDKLEIDETAV